MGRNKQPIEAIVAKGNSHKSKAEIEERRAYEIKAPSDNIVAPDYLTEKQKEAFNDYADQLLAIRIMTNLDVKLLAQYVSVNDMYEKITRKLRSKEVSTNLGLFDYYIKQQERYVKMCRSLCNDLGFSPVSRAKLSVPPATTPTTPENKFSKFRKGED